MYDDFESFVQISKALPLILIVVIFLIISMRKSLYILFILCLLVACKKNEPAPLFKTLTAAETGISFQNTLGDSSRFNIIEYLYYYNGAGTGVGDFNNDGLSDIYMVSNKGENKLYINKGNCKFEDITQSAGVGGTGDWKTGVSIVDINADGWLDIYVSQVSGYKGLEGRNQLFINNKNNTFTESAAAYHLAQRGFCQQAAFFDFDKDGDLDVYILRHSVHQADNYKDGDMRTERDSLAGDQLLRNDNGIFNDISAKAGIYGSSIGYGLGIVVSDLNADGWPDIYVTNDFHESDYLYYNNQNGTFREAIRESVGHTSMFSMGVDAADLNNDALPDVMTLDMKPNDEAVYKSSVGPDAYDIYNYKKARGFYDQFPRNMLFVNQGTRAGTAQFSEQAQLSGVSATDWSWSVLMADFDNDAQKDIFVSNGIARRPNDLDYLKFVSNGTMQIGGSDEAMISKMPKGDVPNVFFKNNGNLQFSNQTEWAIQKATCTNGAAYADFDNDGDMDLVLNHLNQPVTILQNQAQQVSKAHYLDIRLASKCANTKAIGSKITVFTNQIQQTQELSPVRGFLSSVDYKLHFGLGDASIIDSIHVLWPDLTDTVLYQIPSNQVLLLSQNNVSKSFLNKAFNKNKIANARFFQDFEKKFPYTHIENKYSDNAFERLIPYFESTQSPCMAKGDINGDGLEDIFVGAARGKSRELFLQDASGTLKKWPSKTLALDSTYEAVAATFADVDGDKDLDLYVVAGGNEMNQDKTIAYDRLYLNDGKGNFLSTNGQIPNTENTGSCIAAADIDSDGDVDFFVGRRCVAMNYGATPNSAFLINDGKGHFMNQIANIAPELERIGMVSHATFADMDGNGSPDLVLVGEWMSVTIAYNNTGHFDTKPIDNSSGLWSALQLKDMDNDGDLDIVAGNFGINVPFPTNVKSILEMNVIDVDKNETKESLISYERNGKRFPLFFKDDLTSQIPSLKKRFLEYKAFANTTFSDVFTPEMLKGSLKKSVQTLHSQWFENIGNKKWQAHILPNSAQVAPIYALQILDVNGDGLQDIIAAGNLYEVPPVIGRMDASYGVCLLGQPNKTFLASPFSQSGFYVQGQVRSMEILTNKQNKTLLIARNNASAMRLKLIN